MTITPVASAPGTPANLPSTAGRPRRRRLEVGRATAAVVGVLGAAAVWSAVAASGVFPRALFPPLNEVAAAGLQLWLSGDLYRDTLSSITRSIEGFALGSIAGFLLATVTAATASGRTLLQPVLRLLAPVPTIGLVPLVILWFGIGEPSKVTVVALGVFVPVWINSHAGLSTTPTDFLQAAHCLGARRSQILTQVVIPEAIPDVVAGLRVGAAMAYVLIVVAEMTGTTSGLGFRIYQSQLFSQADRLIFCLIVLAVLGAVTDIAIARLSTPFTRWSTEER